MKNENKILMALCIENKCTMIQVAFFFIRDVTIGNTFTN